MTQKQVETAARIIKKSFRMSSLPNAEEVLQTVAMLKRREETDLSSIVFDVILAPLYAGLCIALNVERMAEVSKDEEGALESDLEGK